MLQTCGRRVTIVTIPDIIDVSVVIEQVGHAVATVHILPALGVVGANGIIVAIDDVLVIAVAILFVAVVVI